MIRAWKQRTKPDGAPGQHLPQSQFYSNRIDPANPTGPVNPTRLFQLTPYTTKNTPNTVYPCPPNSFQPFPTAAILLIELASRN